MKKFAVLILVLTAMLSLTTVARADVITINPLEAAIVLTCTYWPAILVVAVVIVTMLLLKRFKKK